MKRGFSFVELVVAISIVSLVSTIVIASLRVAQEKGRLGSGRYFSAQVSHIIGDYIVGSWDLDEGSGIDAHDRSGNLNNGVLLGNPSWSTDTPLETGRSIQFDGVDDAIEVPYSKSLAPASALTLGAWFKVASLGSPMDIVSKTQSGGYQLSINENNTCPQNTLCGLVNVGGAYFSATYPSSNLAVDRWYYALVTYDGEVLSLYLDGRLVASNGAPSGPIAYTVNNSLCIGAEPGMNCTDGNYFDGSIDDVKVYAKSVTANEASKVYTEALKRRQFALR